MALPAYRYSYKEVVRLSTYTVHAVLSVLKSAYRCHHVRYGSLCFLKTSNFNSTLLFTVFKSCPINYFLIHSLKNDSIRLLQQDLISWKQNTEIVLKPPDLGPGLILNVPNAHLLILDRTRTKCRP